MTIADRAYALKTKCEALEPAVQALADKLASVLKPLEPAATFEPREAADSQIEEAMEVALQSAEKALDLVTRLTAAVDL